MDVPFHAGFLTIHKWGWATTPFLKGNVMKVKIKHSCAGVGISFIEGQIVEIDKSNAEVLESKLRHGTAVVVGEEPKKKVEEGGGQVENPDVLHDAPPRSKGRGRTRKAEGS